jgi:hypothetical protein
MPMGIKNAAAFFVCIVLQMKKEWDATWSDEKKASSLIQKTFERYEGGDDRLEQAETLRSAKTGSSVVVDDLIVYAMNVKGLLAYWECILQTLLHYRVTIRLRKTRFLPTRAEFVGVDVLASGNSPAQSKYESISKLPPPALFSDLRMFIGLLGFYAAWIPLYETRITRWRDYIKKKPPVNTPKETEQAKLKQLWNEKDDVLFDSLKKDIINGPILKRADFDRRFYYRRTGVHTPWRLRCAKQRPPTTLRKPYTRNSSLEHANSTGR